MERIQRLKQTRKDASGEEERSEDRVKTQLAAVSSPGVSFF